MLSVEVVERGHGVEGVEAILLPHRRGHCGHSHYGDAEAKLMMGSLTVTRVVGSGEEEEE